MIPDRSLPSRVCIAAFRALDCSGPIRRDGLGKERGPESYSAGGV